MIDAIGSNRLHDGGTIPRLETGPDRRALGHGTKRRIIDLPRSEDRKSDAPPPPSPSPPSLPTLHPRSQPNLLTQWMNADTSPDALRHTAKSMNGSDHFLQGTMVVGGKGHDAVGRGRVLR